ncbi:MAG: hypothetical protein ACLT1T_03595 [Oscillospiraceae bacterium]
MARAMLQNAPMLILDEATSSVDTRTDFHPARDGSADGKRTSFVIAHRPRRSKTPTSSSSNMATSSKAAPTTPSCSREASRSLQQPVRAGVVKASPYGGGRTALPSPMREGGTAEV